MKANLRQTSQLLKKLLPTKIPIMLLGSPGLGKSAVNQSVADHFNLYNIDLRVTTLDPADFSGLPSVKDGKMVFNPLDVFPLEGDDYPVNPLTGKKYSGWLINLEELLDAKPAIQSATYKLILDRMVNQKKLHSDCYIVASSNLLTDNACAGSPSTALQSRFIWIEVEADFEQWKEDFAIPTGISPYIISYLEFTGGNSLSTFDPKHTGNTYACSRTWSFLSKVIIDAFNNDIIDDELFEIASFSTIGSEAVDFVSYLKHYKDLPTVEEITLNPSTTKVPEELGALYALKRLLVDSMTEENINAFGNYIEKMTNKEVGYLFYSDLKSKFLKDFKNIPITNIPSFKQLSKDYIRASSTTN